MTDEIKKEDTEILSPEQARQWLNDFLAQQQEESN